MLKLSITKSIAGKKRRQSKSTLELARLKAYKNKGNEELYSAMVMGISKAKDIVDKQ